MRQKNRYRVISALDFEKPRLNHNVSGLESLYVNVVRTGVMLNSTTDSINKVIEAMDAGLALC